MTITVQNLTKTYGSGETATHALRGVSFEIDAGEFVVLLGASGSGKTTCLNMIGAIEEPTDGDIKVAGTQLVGIDGAAKTAYRRDKVGFVFQFYNLVPTLTALENVQLIAELGHDIRGSEAEALSTQTLASVGLAERVDHFPGQLSGGEQQRVAIARALAKDPAVLLCDEPTGALDLPTGRQVLELLRQTTGAGRTILLVTHNSVIAKMADRVLHLGDGRLESDEPVSDPIPPSELTW